MRVPEEAAGEELAMRVELRLGVQPAAGVVEIGLAEGVETTVLAGAQRLQTVPIEIDGAWRDLRRTTDGRPPVRGPDDHGGGIIRVDPGRVKGSERPARPLGSDVTDESAREGATMDLGTFSVSLAVRDLEASRAFYEKLGFTPFFGEAAQGWLILKNGDVAIGLFQGMFERNILTFNPGWDGNAQPLDTFTDVRELQRELRAKGVEFQVTADESTTGPASFIAVDPDGNPVLVDQHV